MKKNNVYFTNLGIVKCKAFELTNEQFLERMTSLINEKPELYHVNYDEENDVYLVFFNGEKYTVKFGRDGYCEKSDSLEILNKLIEITNNIDEFKKETEEKSAYDRKQRDIAFKNAEEGILNTNNEKLAKIEIIKSNFKKSNPPLLKTIRETFEVLIFDNFDSYFATSMLAGIILAVVLAIVGCILGSLPVALLGCGIEALFLVDSGIAAIVNKITNREWNGVLLTVFSLLIAPINGVIKAVDKIVNTFRYKKAVKKIKETITHFEKVAEFVPKNKVNIDEVNKYLNDGGINALKTGPTDLEEIINMVTNLKDKILKIKDKNTSKQLAIELFEIIKYYADSSIKLYDTKPTILSNQMLDLDRRIDEAIRNEIEKEEFNNEYDSMMETINHQKSIGSR